MTADAATAPRRRALTLILAAFAALAGCAEQDVGTSPQASNALRGAQPDLVPTLGQLVDQVNEARRSGAEVADMDVDLDDRHPVRITIDPRKNTNDDESCFTISDYTPS